MDVHDSEPEAAPNHPLVFEDDYQVNVHESESEARPTTLEDEHQENVQEGEAATGPTPEASLSVPHSEVEAMPLAGLLDGLTTVLYINASTRRPFHHLPEAV